MSFICLFINLFLTYSILPLLNISFIYSKTTRPFFDFSYPGINICFQTYDINGLLGIFKD